ncbi:hypothetical protein [Pseudokineococcus sp. 1T1Z-3]|uniref:hypothetical protein n=1 Tax=Pseudokineococcus sp. 1T1Z-3 TaxID=3132745 RepID=UPI00309A3B6C
MTAPTPPPGRPGPQGDGARTPGPRHQGQGQQDEQGRGQQGRGQRGDDDRDAAREAAGRALVFSLLLLGALLASRLPGLWSAVGLLFTVSALVVGGLALAAAWRARRRGSVSVLAGGLVLTGFVLVSQSAALLIYPLQGDLRDCLAGAVTTQAQAACQQQFTQDVTSWAERLGGSAPGG